MSKEQIAFWGASGLSARVNTLETKTQLNEENIILLNEQVHNLEVAVFPQVYGQFSSSTTQPISTSPTGSAITFNTYTSLNVECVLVGTQPSSQIQVGADGIYRILFSLQLNRNGGSTGSVYAYLVVNDIPEGNTTTKMTINGNQEDCMTVELFAVMYAGQHFSINCYSPTAGQEALAIPTTSNYPAVPSIIASVQRISNIN